MPRFLRLSLCLTTACLLTASRSHASVYGTMSNFDVFNETETEVHGAEIELEGVHPEDISRFFPAHFDSKTVSTYDDGAGAFGVRVVYEGYNFNGSSSLSPTVGQSTNGHTCVGTPGCEHFGFSTVGAQPTASRFYWHDAGGARIDNAPQQVPMPSWTYMPGAGGGNPILRAEVEPVEVIEQKPDSIWMKVFKTEIERAVDLDELMSGNVVVPEDVAETETEWELLEGGKMDMVEDELQEGVGAVIRRYEYYEYTGAYDEENEPLSIFLDGDLPEPPEGELGQFISANMVAANLVAPVRTTGDYNGDGRVDAADYAVWRSQYGKEDEYEADGDDDGDVDMDDYGVWRDHFGDDHGNGPLGADAAAPEPTALALCLAAAGFAARRRQRIGVEK